MAQDAVAFDADVIADVIIVGAGAAGCALAARLSSDPTRRILLLEAGPTPRRVDDFPPGLLDAGTVEGARPGHPQNWSYQALLTPTRPYSIARGRILGGSTSTNGGYFIRARRDDFERWSAGGNDAWSWENALALYRAAETDLDYGSTAAHGDNGPMHVQRPPQNDGVTRAFTAAASALGFVDEMDKNDQSEPGIGPVPMDVDRGIRWNAGIAYVLPAHDRANLKVRGDTTVTRLLFDDKRVTGVETGSGERIHAAEVIVCAGSVATPQLLMLSGIGERAPLEALGIDVVIDHPGVGAHFSDHPQIAVRWRARPGTIDLKLPRTMGSVLAATTPDAAITGDIELLPMLKPTSVLLGEQGAGDDVLEILIALQAPASRGSIRLASADPLVPPQIEYHYLSTETDRKRMRYAVRLAARLLETDAFRHASLGRVDLPDDTIADDAALDAWIAAGIGTSIHACGSVPFGVDDAVVDQYGTVLGLQGLRVADTSILPTVPTRGPAATAILVGELIAAAMLRG